MAKLLALVVGAHPLNVSMLLHDEATRDPGEEPLKILTNDTPPRPRGSRQSLFLPPVPTARALSLRPRR